VSAPDPRGPGYDRRPWLIISKREAEALLAVARDYLHGAPLAEAPDLRRAERVITLQLEYIIEGTRHAQGITEALIRDMRAPAEEE
jgi:hypothetical protein